MENNIEIIKLTTELNTTTQTLKELVSELKTITVGLESRVAKLEEESKIREAIERDRQAAERKKDKKLARLATILRIMVILSPIAIGVFSYLSYEKGLITPTPLEQSKE